MIPYFIRAGEDQPAQGDRTYLENIQKMFVQDGRGGLIEVSPSPDEQLVYLYLAGQPVAIYHVLPTQAVSCEPGQAPVLVSPDIPMRYLYLPELAVRSVWQALAWYPPVRGAHLDGQTLGAYLDALRVERVNGLLHLILPDLDGFLLLQDGVVVRNETCLASAHGFLDSLPNLQASGSSWSGSCDIWLSELRPGVMATEVALLRIAFSAWVSQWLGLYQHMVGYNLITPVNQSINGWMQHQRCAIRLVGGSLVDHHLFTASAPAVVIYRSLVERLNENLSQVIGDHLAARTAADALNSLRPAQQRILVQQGVTQGY